MHTRCFANSISSPLLILLQGLLVSCGVFNRVVQGPLRNSTVYEGGVAELWCQFHAVYNASIEWSRHKDELNSQAIVTTRKSPFNGTLFLVTSKLLIPRTKLEDRGEYLCSVNSSIPPSQVSTTATSYLTVMRGLETRVDTTFEPPISVSVIEGQRLKLTCKLRVNTHNGVKIKWVKDTGDIPLMVDVLDNVVPIENNLYKWESQLYIQSVTLEDQGRYKCMAKKRKGFSIAASDLATVRVTSSGSVKIMGKNYYLKGNIIHTLIKANYHLGSHKDLVWLHDGAPIYLNDPHYAVEMDNLQIRLEIMGDNRRHYGLYAIQIGNHTEIRDSVLHLIERVSAKVVPRVLELQQGDLAKFECQAGGVHAKGKWLLMHQHDTSHARIMGNILIIPSVRNEDSGTYLCMVTSLIGNAYSHGELFVTVPIKLEIVDLQSLNKSTDGTLRAVRPDGDFVAKYSCSSFPVMDANLTWLMPEDFPSVPEGVELHYRSSETVLYWSRRLKPSDSGTYTCQLVQRKETSLGYLKLSVFTKHIDDQNELQLQKGDSNSKPIKITESPYFIPSLSVAIGLTCIFVTGISSFLLYVFCYKRRSSISQDEVETETAQLPRAERNSRESN